MCRLVIFFSLILCLGISAACDHTVELDQDQRVNFIGAKYGQKIDYFKAKKLSPELVFRPTTNALQHGRILETNPHFNGVRVCEGHRTKIYVGVFPYITMPDLRGLNVQKAEEKLHEISVSRNVDGIIAEVIKIHAPASEIISSQSPEPGEWLYVDLKANGRTVPVLVDKGPFVQRVIVQFKPKLCPQCPVCEVCKAADLSLAPEDSIKFKTVLSSVAGTVVASAVLISAMGGPAHIVQSLAQRGFVQPIGAPIAPSPIARFRRYRLRLKRAP